MDLHDFKKHTVRQELAITEDFGRIYSFIDFGNVNYWFNEDRLDHEGAALKDNDRLAVNLGGLRDFSLLFSVIKQKPDRSGQAFANSQLVSTSRTTVESRNDSLAKKP